MLLNFFFIIIVFSDLLICCSLSGAVSQEPDDWDGSQSKEDSICAAVLRGRKF